MVNQPAPPIAGEAEFWAGVANAQRFFMGNAEVQYALQKLTAVLDAAGIPYAIAGAMALNHHGYRRVTVDVDRLPQTLAHSHLICAEDPGSPSRAATASGT
jgi:hypothetical protein